jgi:hypothetical protein
MLIPPATTATAQWFIVCDGGHPEAWIWLIPFNRFASEKGGESNFAFLQVICLERFWRGTISAKLASSAGGRISRSEEGRQSDHIPRIEIGNVGGY